jgi:hypothetical protein
MRRTCSGQGRRLIFLRYADVCFTAVEKDLKQQAGARRKIGATDYHAAGVTARYAELLKVMASIPMLLGILLSAGALNPNSEVAGGFIGILTTVGTDFHGFKNTPNRV